MAAKADDSLPPNPLSKRDKETLHRLLKKYSKAEFDDLIAVERSRLVRTTKSDRGAPRSPKAQQALLVALYVARCCHALCVDQRVRRPISVRGAAQEIYEVVEIRIIRPRKHGLPTVRNIKSVRALHEDLRSGLRNHDPQTVAATIVGLVWWRRKHVNPKWGWSGSASVKQTVSIFPKNPTKLIRWIDALIATFSL
jgi:hypothetical protein